MVRPVNRERRRFLKLGLAGAVALPAAAALSACGGESEPAAGSAPRSGGAASPPEPAPAPQPTRAPAPAPGGAPSADALVTELPAMAATVQALQYTNQSTKPDQRCANCQFYTPSAPDAQRGACQLFAQGRVAAAGWCASWTPKAGPA